MPFNVQEDVYIVSRDDTGEVKDSKKDPIYLVVRDTDKSEGEHHEQDLIKLPCHVRIQHRSFYYVVTANRTDAGRGKKTAAYRTGGGRIR